MVFSGTFQGGSGVNVAEIQSGKTTKEIVSNIQDTIRVNSATAGLPTSVANITANFKAVNESLKSVAAELGSSAKSGTGANAPGTGISGGSNTSQDSSSSSAFTTDRIIESLEQFKGFLGPIGIGALLLIAILAVKK